MDDYEYYDEEEERIAEIEERPWWDKDFSYLPIHHFQRYVKEYCQDLTENKRLSNMNEFWDKITPQMLTEYNREYKYYYGKGTINTSDKIEIYGYTSGFITIFLKILCYYLENPTNTLKTHIKEFYNKIFNRKRYWNDDVLDRIDKIMSSHHFIESD